MYRYILLLDNNSRVAAPKYSGLFYNSNKNRKQNRFNSRESINDEF